MQTLDEILFANLDVTIGALSWLLVNLATHPAVQRKLYDEIQHAAASGRDNYIQASGTYLAHCISESARVRPIAAFSVPQRAPTERIVSGWTIPAGTSVMVDAYGLNIRNPFWGQDGSLFRPERWTQLKPSETRYNMWRFGFGPRMCMGRFLAETVLRMVVVELVRERELSVVEDDDRLIRVDPNSWITHPDVRIAYKSR